MVSSVGPDRSYAANMRRIYDELTDLRDGTFADIAGAGTVEASKVVVVDANKDIGDFRNLDVTNLDAGLSGTAGTVDVFPATAAKGKLAVTCTDQTGDTTVSLVAGAMAGATTITLRDPGAAASFVTTTDATAAATAATVVEITRACDASVRVVPLTGTTTITELEHDGKLLVIDNAVGFTSTLPAATGSGGCYRFYVKTTVTSGTMLVQALTGDIIVGAVLFEGDAASDAAQGFTALLASNFIRVNISTTAKGGTAGSFFELMDVATDRWAVTGTFHGTGTEETPFTT